MYVYIYIYMLVATPTTRASPIAHPFCHLAMKVPPDTRTLLWYNLQDDLNINIYIYIEIDGWIDR